MTTLAANAYRVYETSNINEIPVIAADIIYEGAAVGSVKASGHARPLTSADRFEGFAEKKADNSSGAAAAINVRVKTQGKIKLSVSGAVITDIGQPVYATDLHGNPGPLRIAEARGELRGDLASTDVRRRVEYVVTGYVDNESRKSFSNVSVQVNLFQFGERLLAAKTVRVGTIPPWGRRAFSTNIRLSAPADEQVWRFECRLIY